MRLWLLLALWIVAGGAEVCRAETPAPTIREVQAAFLFNFTKFITWPEDSFQRNEKSVIIGVLGDDPFVPVLEEALRDKSLNGKTLVVKRFARVQDAANSHTLFLSSSQETHLPHILKVLEATSILTVSDMEQFAERGGMIAFTMKEQKVRFNINVEAVERAGLKIGSHLLKLARIVSRTPRGGN